MTYKSNLPEDDIWKDFKDFEFGVPPLKFEETIVWVHDDMDPWAALSVGFNDNREFVIELTFDSMGNDSPKQHYNKQVIVDQKGTDRLIDQLNTRLTKLPEAFA